MKPENIIAQIKINVGKKHWSCLAKDCTEISINSHLIQQNGLLSNISVDGHLIEVKMTDANKWSKKVGPINFQRVGKKQALSLDIFCATHDTNLFKEIEKENADLESYKSFLLFGYRAVCAEIRKKEVNIETYNRILNSNLLIGKINTEMFGLLIIGNTKGIEDLDRLKLAFENEIDNSEDKFVYKVYNYPQTNIYASAVFSASEEEKSIEEPDLENVYIHILPLHNKSIILIGYHKDYTSDKIIEYCSSWNGLSENDLQTKLTGLFINKIENWGLSPTTFNAIKENNKIKFLKTLQEYSLSPEIKEFLEINLFEP